MKRNTIQNWKDIDINFTEKLQKEWESKRFNYEQTKEWIEVGLQISEASYAKWLRDTKKVDAKWVLDYGNNEQLRKEYWHSKGFTDEEISSWIRVGLGLQDSGYVAWLRGILKITPNEYPNHLDEDGDDSLLREQHQMFLEERKKSEKDGNKNWKNIHPDFTPELANEWEKSSFNYEEAKKWINNTSLQPSESELAQCLKVGHKEITEYNKSEIENKLFYLREMKKRARELGLVNAQEWLDQHYLSNSRANIVELNIGNRNLWGKLKLEGFINLERLVCDINRLTDLDLSDCTNLRELWCNNNHLISANFLTTLKNPERLLRLTAINNHFNEKLTCFSRFTNLIALFIGRSEGSSFYGSLEPLKNLKNLTSMIITDTDIDSGLKYLPDGLENFWCGRETRLNPKCLKLDEELKEYPKGESNYDVPAWKRDFVKRFREKTRRQIQESFQRNNVNLSDLDPNLWNNEGSWEKHLDQLRNWEEIAVFSENMQKNIEEVDSSRSNIESWTRLEGVDIAPLIPIALHRTLKERNRLEEKHYLEESEKVKYNELYEGRRFFWKDVKNESLPIRLYDINKERLIEIGKETNIDHYATLSYVWGDTSSLEIKKIETEKGFVDKKLSPGAKKSLTKAIEACRYLDIDYLWMDQLCIDQDNIEEKNQEVPKMRQYYSNAAITLIAIQSKLNSSKEKGFSLSPLDIIEKVINSRWFSRSWAFQEGWLSKNTIFMFDDILIDGRHLAANWVLNQPLFTDFVKDVNHEELSEGSRKIATPLGWVYCKEEINNNDIVSLSLSQALRGIKERNRTLSIDGIYSILGLLPYGNKVVPKYKEWRHRYTQEELREAILEVMKTAWESGYGEVLTWHGKGDGLVPNIRNVKEGSTSVVGGMTAKWKNSNLENIKPFASENIEINGAGYVIDNAVGELSKVENSGGFLVEGGLCTRNIRIRIDKKHNYEKIMVWGTKEVLERVEGGNVLIVPSSREWESNIPFAILTSRDENIYHRLGLVELRLRSVTEKLRKGEEKKIVIRANISRPLISPEPQDDSTSLPVKEEEDLKREKVWQQRIASLEREIQELRKLKSRIEVDSHQKNDELTNEIKKAGKEKEQLESKLRGYDNNLTKLDKLRNELTKKDEEITDLKENLASEKFKTIELEKQLTELTSSNSFLIQQIENLNNQLIEFQKKGQVMKTKEKVEDDYSLKNQEQGSRIISKVSQKKRELQLKLNIESQLRGKSKDLFKTLLQKHEECLESNSTSFDQEEFQKIKEKLISELGNNKELNELLEIQTQVEQPPK